MFSLHLLVAIAALLSTSASTPVNIIQSLEKDGTFQLHQVERRRIHRNGAVEVHRTHRKFGSEAPFAVKRAVDAAGVLGNMAARAIDPSDSAYTSPIMMGCSRLDVQLDTGSADFWGFSAHLPSNQTSGHYVYDPSNCSTSYIQVGANYSVHYGDGDSSAGLIYADRVVVAGITQTSQIVGAATAVSPLEVEDSVNDGVLGLAFGEMSNVKPAKANTFFENVRGSLAKPLFAARLKYHAAGAYDFGYTDTSKYTGTLAWVDVTTTHSLWEFTASGFGVGNGPVIQLPFNTIADTGTALIYLPSYIVVSYYTAIPGAKYNYDYGGWTLPCNSKPPSLSILIGGQTRTVEGTYMNYAPVSSSTCFGSLQPSDLMAFSILGGIFLKSQYVVFSYPPEGVPRLAFAQQRY